MRILILGGTEFVGRALVAEAVAAGHDVTMLNRGTKPAIDSRDAQITTLVADRRDAAGLRSVLEGAGAGWDAVLDTWSWEPYAVRDTARILEPLTERYLYVSTRSVYADPLPAGADETAPVVAASADDGDPEGSDPDRLTAVDPSRDYSRVKAGGERAVLQSFGERATLLRAGLILGPHENIGRLPWWLARMARGGEVLAPGRPEYGIQYVDARDLAAFALLLATAENAGGAFDVVSPADRFSMGELLQACIAAAAPTDRPTRLRWVDEDLLLSAGVAPWIELPIWLPQGEDHQAMHESDVSTAVAAGLRHRPLQETVADTWSWLRSIGGAAPQRMDRPVLGLDPEKEAAILRSP
ncbi:NAD-dependent epimerase/dehydratase family protein [Naasia lichenicola]|uniref:NAD-dependent epimerase/dehydratase family protein n=1 Tax=Naasia lichenicola TaxID=2565933 RepID=A0A4S4FV59_9MICO|nr:NAD-dependent epimerase/dehydratase family protein [Naasia lichenicola]THG33526.1 NAD-dependent epimerase/dehydratase family protein [Naasia lichenicola]